MKAVVHRPEEINVAELRHSLNLMQGEVAANSCISLENRCQWCQKKVIAGLDYCASCGIPTEKSPPRYRRRVDWLYLAMSIAFLVMLASATSWLNLASHWLIPASTIATGTTTLIWLGRRWLSRQPIRIKSSAIRFEERPLAYHFCMMTGAGFALLLLLAGAIRGLS